MIRTDERALRMMRQSLKIWGKQNGKNYPWRYLEDPYMILVSEFMLHRTQVNQVIPVYEVFIQKYPNIKAFYDADNDEIRMLLNSLGLSWRIEGMIMALREIHEKYTSIPVSYDKLIAIQGIGQYIAGATICFSTNEPVTLVDTNTVRVTGRLLGFDLSGEARRRKEIIQAIGNLLDPENPRDYYYYMIDLAHTLCLPKKPACDLCPLIESPCHFGNKS